jgi:hypothetical protein
MPGSTAPGKRRFSGMSPAIVPEGGADPQRDGYVAAIT